MTILSAAVAAFSLLSLYVWWGSGSLVVILLALSSAALSVTTYLSPRMSTYLRIFSTLFAVETVAFGLCAYAVNWGVWPDFLSGARVPETLPLTVSVFGWLVFALSFVPVIRLVMRKADPYFEAAEQSDFRLPGMPNRVFNERTMAIALIVFLVVLNQFQVYVSLVLNFFNRDFYNAIQEKNQPEFWRLLWQVFTVWAAISVASQIIEIGVQGVLVLRWRRWLTSHMIDDWLGKSVHYRMTLTGQIADNPDQRIAEDVRNFIGGTSASGVGTYDFSISLIAQLSSLVTFSILLWNLSANLTLPGMNLHIPGLLFWFALIYAVLGTLATHFVGKPLVRLSFDQQKFEANFRFSMARIREYAEQIALLAGEPAERKALARRFADIYANFIALIKRMMKLNVVVGSYNQISVLVPFVIAAPFYFAGQIMLGVLTQTASAFDRVASALSYFINSYRSLAIFKAVLDRLTSFDDSAARIRAAAEEDGALRIGKSGGADLAIPRLKLALPNGREIVAASDLTLRAGESTLFTGPSGSGKSTLFRAIAGVWPYGEGAINAPDGKSVMLLPQRPYLPLGTLRHAVSYPQESGAYSDEAIRAALTRVNLAHLIPDLDRADQWQQRLSGGEQQRLAIARALLAKPDWLFLDEATASLDEGLEKDVYAGLKEALPQTTIVSIGHRSSLIEMHRRRLALEPDGDIFVVREKAAAA